MQKTISIILSFLLLMSGTQLAFGQHFCEGQVVQQTIMLGQANMSCDDLPLHDTCDVKTEKEETADCCKNIFYQVETDADYAGSHFEIPANSAVVAILPSVFKWHVSVISVSNKIETPYFLKPPLLQKDVVIWHQSFLI